MATDFESLFQSQAIPALQSIFGETYIYRRSTDIVELTTEAAPHEEVESEERGFKTTWRGLRFTITASDIVIDGVVVTPTKGDQLVKYLDDGTAVVYTVLPPKGKPAYEKIGDGYQLLVYAKEYGTE